MLKHSIVMRRIELIRRPRLRRGPKFAHLRGVSKLKRSKHSLSHYRLLTCDMGELIPVACMEVLPGDSLQQSTSLLLRCSPLLAPVMHPVSVRVHHWYVPYRLLWDDWEDFITGGDGQSGYSGTYPTITSPGGGWAVGSLPDYFGLPTGVANLEVCAFPFRAYSKIWNEFYRDEDLQAEIAEDQTDITPISWEKDYFSSARPWPQKGGDVTLPLGTSAPVKGIGAINNVYSAGPLGVYETGETAPTVFGDHKIINPAGANTQVAIERAGSSNFPNIYADLSAATSVDVNTVRLAFALQRYQEARARWGSRYTEYLRYLGVRSSDARLQRPEYLGGGKQTITFSEVLQSSTGADADNVVGTMRGHGISAMRSRRYRRFFEEHGVVLSLLSIRPKVMYANGVHRQWSRRTKEDYWQKELEHIGNQEVYNREIYAQGNGDDDDVFGYQDRYAEYRHIPSGVSGLFRSTLNYWHLARILAAKPSLNSSFIQCVPSKRINAEQTKDALWIMAMNSVQARRMVSKSASSYIF
ncbi:major capsid protein [Apis mellifera associated microvirus 50]|nr:major capsid protein [Apis mellifera associated microvirus 50]